MLTREEFTSKYNSMSLGDFAKEQSVSKRTIARQARKYGLPYKKRGGAKPIKSITIGIEELKKLYFTTKTSDLAKRLNICVATLVKILKEHGVEMKRPGGKEIKKRKLIVEG